MALAYIDDLTSAPTEAHNLREWAHCLPKIDLHRHLEGSLRLQTLAEIAQEQGLDLPSYDIEGLRPHVQMTDDPRDFKNFLSKFQLLRRFYTSKQAVQRIAREAILDAAADNVRYLELRFNPVALARVQKFPLNDVVEWVIEAAQHAQQDSGTRTCLILQIGRNEPLTIADEITDLAITYHGPMVRGIDLAGNEVTYPARRFATTFQRAKNAGLNITIHAGEAINADSRKSIETAVFELGAQRIGHGIRAVEASDVAQMLRERHITLEICPTSNLHTGVVRGFSQHPLYDLFNLGLHVTLNTDDPSISATTLSDEYIAAVAEIGLEHQRIYQMLGHSVEAAFIPEEEREGLRQNFHQWLHQFPQADVEFDATQKA